ncbi:MAG: amino acid ABC transporter substrate-binding protein [Oscillatoriales cyanobacterium SM2_2_1]|nr:amino acid ABC transporter substrate-binding protein [Oscillatoriales cyanobacterium SM2_2_1]
MVVEFSCPRWALGLAVLALCLSLLWGCAAESPPNASSPGASRLDLVKSRGQLICGVSGELPGFSFVDAKGQYSGLDVDLCRAIAAALFDDPQAVQYRNLNAKERFTALQTGEIDILSRNTTWTISRDTVTKLEFITIVFFDGQGLMVRANSNINNLEGLRNAAICAQNGTTTELNLSDQMRKRRIPYQPVTFEDVNATFAAYEAGRCQAITADRSALITRRTRLSQPKDHRILDLALSKEPLAPAVLDGDSQWFNAVKAILFALIEAEELGITQANSSQQPKDNATVQRFLGGEGTLGSDSGLTNDFAARAIRHGGNFGEIYERNLGRQSAFQLPRSQNNLWNQQGLLLSPPFR